MPEKNPRIEVRELATGRVIHVIQISNPSTAEKVLRGLLRQMDRERFLAVELDC